jgi:hypothetical protein
LCFCGGAQLLAGCEQVLGIDQAHFAAPPGAAGTAPIVDENVSGSEPGSDAVAGGGAGGIAGSFAVGGEPDEGGNFSASGAEAASGAAGDAPVGQPLSLCDEYCAEVMNGCTAEHAQYIDLDACRAACADYPQGSAGDKSGNSINCRLTYAKKASSEPYTYCTWAGPGGDGKCGANCDGFCTMMMRVCTAETAAPGDYLASAASCEQACGGLKDVGNYNSSDASLQTGDDHVQCRLYHVGAAIAEDDPLTHCHHAMGFSLCHAPTKK